MSETTTALRRIQHSNPREFRAAKFEFGYCRGRFDKLDNYDFAVDSIGGEVRVLEESRNRHSRKNAAAIRNGDE